MNAEPIAPHLRAIAPDAAARLAHILACVATLIAYRLPRKPRYAAIVGLLHAYFIRAGRRLIAAMDRLATGRILRADPRRGRSRSHKPRLLIPTGQGWLIREIPHEAAAFAGYLEQLLAEPGVAELLAACPAAQRILKPIRHALSIEQPLNRKRLPYNPPPGYIPPIVPPMIPLYLYPPAPPRLIPV